MQKLSNFVEYLDLSDNKITVIDIRVLLYRMFKGNYLKIDLRRNPMDCNFQNF